MSEASRQEKWTPGKWRVERVYLSLPKPDLRITAKDGSRYVAEVEYTDFPHRENPDLYTSDIDELRANAHLIAAAPQLYEALKELDDCYCEAGSPGLSADKRLRHRKALIAARSALKAALGEKE